MKLTSLTFLSFLRQREDTEHEQAIIRLVFCIGIGLYLLFWPQENSDEVANKILKMTAFEAVMGLFILLSIFRNPQKSTIRRIFGGVVDISALSYGLSIGGEWAQTLVWIYLFVIIGNGFRYGVNYLYFCSTYSIIGIVVAGTISHHGALNTGMSIGHILGITVISFYLASLLNRLNSAVDEANAANAAKSQFLANMSHEIRTPMNGVLGMLDIALNSVLPEPIRKQLLIAKNSADSLLVILNDILDLSKLDAGKVVLESKDFNPEQVIHEVVDLLQPKAGAKNIQLKLDLPKDYPEIVNGDSHRLRQVLLNLISNAIKFTEVGYVEVSTHAIPSTNGIELNVSITDTGIGIAEEDQHNIFKQFNQADESTTRKFGGTGLGLAISKMIVEQMRGCISFESSYGKGSKFSFMILVDHPQQLQVVEDTIPKIAAVSDLNITANNEPQVARNEIMMFSSPVKVLLVEDNPVNQEVVRMMLNKLGGQIHVMDSGIDTIEYYKTQDTHAFDLILMDCQMPGMDGYETTETLLSMWQNKGITGIPIIALTASTMPEDKARCFKVGMDDYLAKPVRLETLYSMLVRWLPKNKINRDAAVNSFDSDKRIRHNKLLRAIFDVQTLQEVKTMMGRRFPQMVERYEQSSMRLVCEMEKQYAVDRALLSKTSHSLKGSSAALGATKISSLCQTIENQVTVGDSEERIEKNIQLLKKLLLVTVDLMKKMEAPATQDNTQDPAQNIVLALEP